MIQTKEKNLSFIQFKEEILNDYRLAFKSRQASVLGRKEVLSGKAKFGVFSDGKELVQIAKAKAFKNGDFRAGYYRGHTFMMAIGQLTVKKMFAALYAHSDIEKEPFSGGKQMVGHFSTPLINEDGSFKNLLKQKNTSSDVSPTASQMARGLGLAYASKYYREFPDSDLENKFSNKGNEVAFVEIGDGSTSEGVFFEVINAAGVLQVPLVVSVWDDSYAISVPVEKQTVKGSISEVLKGFKKEANSNGWEILNAKGWDYTSLIETYQRAAEIAREKHIPVLVHVQELTQPTGHSTSGSHERYKSSARLQWEKDHDCLSLFRKWILDFTLTTEEGEELIISKEKELKIIEEQLLNEVVKEKEEAFKDYLESIEKVKNESLLLIDEVEKNISSEEVLKTISSFKNQNTQYKKQILSSIRSIIRNLRGENHSSISALKEWYLNYKEKEQNHYSGYLYAQNQKAAVSISKVEPNYQETPSLVSGREIIRDNFEVLFKRYPNLFTFGEDTGKLGDVNQGLEGLQEKFGENRVSDTGIHEAAIVGRGIGAALRGLRPIAEIQYLDYIFYAYYIISDDLATTHFRTHGRQKCPLIIRTRGHRLEGIWHSGSPMQAMLGGFRGVCILSPRNMTQAAGFYNSLMECDDPAIVIEPLSLYRAKEKMPTNLGDFKTPIGEVEVLREGKDVTLLTYGMMCKMVLDAAEELSKMGIDAEVIDAQSLLPFDIKKDVVKSISKTNRFVVIDEDFSGGASAYLLQKVVEEQKAYQFLDSAPKTISAKDHRPAYSTDGDYFSKPSKDDIIEKVYEIFNEFNPTKYPAIF